TSTPSPRFARMRYRTTERLACAGTSAVKSPFPRAVIVTLRRGSFVTWILSMKYWTETSLSEAVLEKLHVIRAGELLRMIGNPSVACSTPRLVTTGFGTARGTPRGTPRGG